MSPHRPARPRARLLLGWLLVASLAGCGEPSDEEKALEMIDTARVHIYVALKIAFAEPQRDPELARTRALIDAALRKAERESDGDPEQVSARDLLALGKALWALRALGRAEVEKGRASTLQMVGSGPPSSGDGAHRLSRETDHALSLLLLTLMKLHPDAPTPIPQEVLLYEAWMLGDAPVPEAELEPLARSAQAYAYASSELCDLATGATDRLAKSPLKTHGDELINAVALSIALVAGAHHAPDMIGDGLTVVLVQNLPWLFRLLAHASTARCLDGRDASEAATVEWQRTLDVAEQVGFPPRELALLRAYLAYRNDDPSRVRAHLEVARDSRLLDARARQDLAALIEHFDPDDRDALDAFFEPVFLTGFVMKMVYQRLQDAGLFQQLSRLPGYRAIRVAFDAVQALPQQAAGLWKRFTDWLGGLWDDATAASRPGPHAPRLAFSVARKPG